MQPSDYTPGGSGVQANATLLVSGQGAGKDLTLTLTDDVGYVWSLNATILSDKRLTGVSGQETPSRRLRWRTTTAPAIRSPPASVDPGSP